MRGLRVKKLTVTAKVWEREKHNASKREARLMSKRKALLEGVRARPRDAEGEELAAASNTPGPVLCPRWPA